MSLVNKLRLIFSLIICLGYSSSVLAQGVEVKPVIIDEVTAIRGIIEKQIQVKNNTAVKVNLYPFVNDISQAGGLQSFDAYAADRSVTLSNWIDFSRRTIELMPGASISVPLRIQVHPQAKTGKYYAAVSLINGVNQADAQSRLKSNTDSVVTINIEVRENKIERCEVGEFAVRNFFNFNQQVEFIFALKNSGNQPIAPSGTIVVYDSRGREVSEIKVNGEGKRIVPDDKEPFSLKWFGDNKIGKFKAKLSLQYGDVIKRDLQDSVYFWVLPKWFLGLVGSMVLILFISIMMLVFRINRLKRSLNEEERSDIIDLRSY